jgi:hypothetical protein
MTDIDSTVTTTVILGSGAYGTTLTIDTGGSVLPNSYSGTLSVGANAVDIPVLDSLFTNNGNVVGAMGGPSSWVTLVRSRAATVVSASMCRPAPPP